MIWGVNSNSIKFWVFFFLFFFPCENLKLKLTTEQWRLTRASFQPDGPENLVGCCGIFLFLFFLNHFMTLIFKHVNGFKGKNKSI